MHLLLIVATGLMAVAADHPFETPDHTRNAFGNPYPRLTRDQRREFFVGNSFFRQSWVQTPSSTPARDGLGPTFNAVSCSSCHQLDGRGPGAFREGPIHVSLLFRLEGADAYGGQLNPFSITDVPAEAQPSVRFLMLPGQFPDGEKFELRQPIYAVVNWMFGTPSPHTRFSPRVGQQLIGLGLLESIPAVEIEKRADPQDLNGDGISGRSHYALNLRTGQLELGRFGWKAEQPSLEQQNAAALNGDIGLTTTLFPLENCPTPQLACQNSPVGGQPEVDDLILSRMTFYMQNIAVPRARVLANNNGRKTFTRIGCAQCHQPSYTVDGIEVFPYTDMLLHDMGEGLADRSLKQQVLPTEWRTPPLWGTGLHQTVSRHTNLLHDGRARGVQEAILWHDGEGRSAKERYLQLTKMERTELIEFVHSL